MKLQSLTARILPPLCALALTSTAMAHNRDIRIPGVEELYAAVNNPANNGRTLVLEPGVYVLSPNDPWGTPRPHGGRLELQQDMKLQGREGNRSAVTIDAFNLPASSFPQSMNGVTTGPNAAVRLGLGHNTLEWLTVRDARFAQANIDSGLQALDPGTAYIRIAHVASTGSTRGLNVLNFGPQTSGQTIEADISDSNFYDNDLNLSEGVRLGNFQGARGSTVTARMTGNASWGQKQGQLIVNNRALESTVNVISINNRFYDNGGGMIIAGGLSSNNTRADYNTINLKSWGDEFTGNRGATELDHGGLVVLGIEDVSVAGGGSFNTVNIELWRASLRDNDTGDLRAVGARALPPASAVNNQNNHVTIEIHGGDRGRRSDHGSQPQPVETFDDMLPAGQNYGNTVTVTHCHNRDSGRERDEGHSPPDGWSRNSHGYDLGACFR